MARAGHWGKEEGAGAEMLRRLKRWAAVEGRGKGGIQDEVHGSGPRTGEWCGHPSDRHPRGGGRFQGTGVEGCWRVS